MILWSKVVLWGKIGLVQFLTYCVLIRKNAREMIFIPKYNILIYFKVRQKDFVMCTHKAHFWRYLKIYDFRWKSLIFPSKMRGSQKSGLGGGPKTGSTFGPKTGAARSVHPQWVDIRGGPKSELENGPYFGSFFRTKSGRIGSIGQKACIITLTKA